MEPNARNSINTHERRVRIERVVALCGADIGGRGISALVDASAGGLAGAAASIIDHPSPRIAIITGWFIPTSVPPAPETDGINGSVQLAAGLISAGIPAMLVTDRPCASALHAACTVIGETIPMSIVGVSSEAVAELRETWVTKGPAPSHLVAVERVGPAADGRLLGQYGFDFTPHAAPFHELFEESGTERSWVTIGIGDGGNEIGMGSLPRALIEEHVPQGAEIACVTPCDHLIVAGVSNWGAYGLLTVVALLRSDLCAALTRYFDPELEWRGLVAAVDRGPAVDGWPERPQYTVDNLPWRRHADLIEELRALLV